MNGEIILSVVVPVYNTDKYLEKCLNSLLNQDLNNYEIICVNDGSTDKSLSILKRYSNDHENIKLVTQNNSGQSVARNKGLQLARGKYLYFMDSDDILEENSLTYIISELEKYDLDMYIFDAVSFLDDSDQNNFEVINYDKGHSYGFYERGSYLLADFVNNHVFTPQPCLYVTRKGFLDEHNISFIEGIIHEDEAFTVEAFLKAGKVIHENHHFFKRRIRPGSTMTNKITEKNFIGYYHVLKKLNKYRNNKAVRKRLSIIFNTLNEIYEQLDENEKKKNFSLYSEIHKLAKENKYYTPVKWLQYNNRYTNFIYRTLSKLKQNLKEGKDIEQI